MRGVINMIGESSLIGSSSVSSVRGVIDMIVRLV